MLAIAQVLALLISSFASASQDGPNRLTLQRQSIEIHLPVEIENEYSALKVLEEGTRIHLEFLHSDGSPNFVYWEPRSLIDVKISNAVKCEGKLYSYNYGIHSDGTSKSSVKEFILETGANIEEQLSPNSHWRSELLRVDLWKRHLYLWATTETTEMGGMIPPGDQLLGYGLQSEGLPTVIRCWAAARGLIPHMDRDLPSSIASFLGKHQGLLVDAVSGFSVGPGERPPTLEVLRDYLRVSLEQGWVCAGEAHTRLAALVAEAVAAEAAKDEEKLVQSLNELEQAVEEYLHADPPQITTEVQALLGINAAWLRAQAEKELAEESTPNQPAGAGATP